MAVITRGLKLFLLASLLVGAFPTSSSQGQASEASQPARITIIRANANEILLEMIAPNYELGVESHDGERYQTLRLPGAGYTTRSGAPQLPVLNALLGAPGDAAVSVQVLEAESQVLPSTYRILPAPTPQTVVDEFSAGTFTILPDLQAYASDDAYPQVRAELTDDAWLRDQRVLRIALYPFQYQAASGRVTWNKRLLVAVRFDGAQNQPRTSSASNDGSTSNPFEPTLQRNLLNYDQALQWRGNSSENAAPVTANATQALSTRYKIVVDQDGLYHITYTDTLASGIPLTNPRNWQLTNLGSSVAITITGQDDGQFNLGDEIIFYGQRFRGNRFAARYPDEASLYWLVDNCSKTYCPPQILNFRKDAALQMEKYTSENVYWLETNGTTPGARMPVSDGTPSGLIPAGYYTTTVHAERQRYWNTYPIVDSEVWFWEPTDLAASATTPLTFTFPITLTAIANVPISPTVRGAYLATSLAISVNPDHHTRVSFNDPPLVLEDVWWDDVGRRAFEVNIPAIKLQEGINNLKYTLYPIPGVGQAGYFDWFEVTYARRFVPVNDELWFRGSQPGAQAFQAGGYSNNRFWALDITQPLTPTFIANPAITGSSSFTATLQVANGAGKEYFLGSSTALKSPKRISAYTPPDLLSATNGADYIFITAQDFITPTRQLAAYRQAQGMRTMVVDINDVYNLFSDGIFNPIAIKNFLRYAYYNWQPPAPRYVLLAGYGHFNFHLYTRSTPPKLAAQTMPPYLTVTDAWQADVDSANQLVTIVGNDMLPDMLIGRMVVDDPQQMQAIVNKIIAYEQIKDQSWQKQLVFLADNVPDGAGDFVAQSDEIINDHIPAGYTTDRLYLNDYIPPCSLSGYCTPIRDDYTDALNNSGALIVNYMGHGSMLNWASPVIFQSSYTSTLTNASQLPIVVDMTCLTGYYYYANPIYRSVLAVEMLRHPTGGSIASFSPTSRGVSTGHDSLARGFYDAIFQDEVRTLGEATLGGQLNLFATGYNLDIINTFVLFGDPALKLPITLHQPAISTPTASTETLPGRSVTYTLTISNAGTITDTFTIHVSGNSWPTQLSQTTVGPLSPGQKTSVTATVQVPSSAPQAAKDVANIVATSQGNNHKSATKALTTTIRMIPGVSISPTSASKQGIPGETVIYTLQISNHGNITDTYSAVISSTWQSTITPLPPIGPLAAGQGRSLTVAIQIPSNPSLGAINTTTITFRSVFDNSISVTASLLTQAIRKMYLPIIVRQ